MCCEHIPVFSYPDNLFNPHSHNVAWLKIFSVSILLHSELWSTRISGIKSCHLMLRMRPRYIWWIRSRHFVYLRYAVPFSEDQSRDVKAHAEYTLTLVLMVIVLSGQSLLSSLPNAIFAFWMHEKISASRTLSFVLSRYRKMSTTYCILYFTNVVGSFYGAPDRRENITFV